MAASKTTGRPGERRDLHFYVAHPLVSHKLWRWDGPCWGQTIKVGSGQEPSRDEIRAFLAGSGEISIQGQNREAICGWADRTLRPQRYQALGWAGRGLVREYVARMTGLSRAQVTRLIRQYPRGGQVQPKAYRRRRWK